MKKMELCRRCQKVETTKRADGVPVCHDCFVADARANHGIALDYSGLVVPQPVVKGPEVKKKRKRKVVDS